jgi:two-component system phosphate regulon sensor histidine kinase PhoR
MRTEHLLLTVVAIAGTPITALAVLAGIGDLRPGPALVAIAVIGVVAIGLSLLWARDLALLADIVRKASAEEIAEPPLLDVAPVLPPVEQLGRDVERLSRAMATRTALVGRLRRADEAIVERLPDPVLVLARDRSLRRANAAARTAFGSDMSAVLRHPGLRHAIDRALSQHATQAAELTVPVPVPREVHATVVVMDPPLADGGEIVAVLSDRTRERAMERTRADFVANASHELRTPLASLSGFIDTLLGPAADDPPAQRRFLGIMAEQATRMSRLIDDLLSLSRIELTEHQPPAEAVALQSLVPRIAAGFEPRVSERRQRMELSLPPDLPPVLGDADQLEQVLQNLLDNAVKYGRDGGCIRVGGQAAQAGSRWPSRPGVVLSVRDEGVGIPRQHLPRLTERFYRVDKSRSRSVGGTGLGLAIVKHIVNRHRGQLLIESEEGVGTTAHVWLPQATAAPAPPPVAALTPRARDTEPA